jgi:hypothetical protein
MARQSGVTKAALDPHPSCSLRSLEVLAPSRSLEALEHLNRRNFAMFGKSVSSGNPITSKGTGRDRWQPRHVT